MGWNEVRVENKCNLTNKFYDNSRFYFVHSYYVKCEEGKHCMLKANYGLEFDAAIHKDNIYGMQFHPEKSHKFGMRIFENFSQI
jgi:glutamine amidotransferase